MCSSFPLATASHTYLAASVAWVCGGVERRLASGGRAGYTAPNEHKAVGVALMDLDDATAGIFANLIVYGAHSIVRNLHEDLRECASCTNCPVSTCFACPPFASGW